MANDVDTLILMVGNDGFTAPQFAEILARYNGNIDMAASSVWEIRAGRYHGLVNISESGSTRAMGDLYKNAIAMAHYYRNKTVDDVVDPGDTTGRTQTRRITRI